MRLLVTGLAVLWITGSLSWLPASRADEARAFGPCPVRHQVAAVRSTWVDPARCRQVPVKIYYPRSGQGPFPVIIFSHGLGGSREGCSYLGCHWASQGYVSVHLQHKGSDDDVWKGTARPMKALREAFQDPANRINRPLDVSFAIDQIERLNQVDACLKGRLDSERIGVAGNDFGAMATLLVAGQTLVTSSRQEYRLADPRVKAVVSMSSPVFPDQARYDVYRLIAAPCMHMTGTEDDGLVGDTRASQRRLPFDLIVGTNQYLVTYQGADHMIYSGHLLPWETRDDPLFQDLICLCSTVFWDAHLKDDPSALASLAGGRLDAALGPHATFEKKLVGQAVVSRP